MGYVAVEMKRLVCKNNSGALQRGGVLDMDVKRTIIFRQVGAKIAYYRTLRGFTQAELAERISISADTLGRIERGKYNNNVSFLWLLGLKLQVLLLSITILLDVLSQVKKIVNLQKI